MVPDRGSFFDITTVTDIAPSANQSPVLNIDKGLDAGPVPDVRLGADQGRPMLKIIWHIKYSPGHRYDPWNAVWHTMF